LSLHLDKMRIGFDIRPFLKQETGVGVYFKNLLIELASLDFENEYYLFSASWKERFDRSKIPTFKKGGFRDVRWPVNAVNFLWYKLGRPRLDSVFKTDLDLTHSPTPIILPTKGKKIVTVCDLFFIDFPGKADRQARTHFLKGTKRSLEVADGVLTISEFTKKALIERFGLGENKIKVTYLGLNRVYLETAAGRGELEAARRALDLPPEYLLFVGATEPRKNLLNLIDALALVHQRYKRIPLVLIGRKGEDHNNLLARIAARDLGPWIKILGYRPDRELRYFYQAASAFILPSFCEGFGLPLIEAMACGVPVVVSGTTAMPEVAGEAASYFNPESPEDMAGQIIHVLKDKGLRHNLIQKGWTRALDFRWEKTAAETLGFYRSVTERK
jgi:glycosyltransferase involved in cell wall biosynthesis